MIAYKAVTELKKKEKEGFSLRKGKDAGTAHTHPRAEAKLRE